MNLLAAVLAVLALLTLRWKIAPPLVWLFNLVGTGDLLLNYYHGISIDLQGMAGKLGAAFFIPIFYVPLLLITHGFAFRLLLDLSFGDGRRATFERNVAAASPLQTCACGGGSRGQSAYQSDGIV